MIAKERLSSVANKNSIIQDVPLDFLTFHKASLKPAGLNWVWNIFSNSTPFLVEGTILYYVLKKHYLNIS